MVASYDKNPREGESLIVGRKKGCWKVGILKMVVIRVAL